MQYLNERSTSYNDDGEDDMMAMQQQQQQQHQQQQQQRHEQQRQQQRQQQYEEDEASRSNNERYFGALHSAGSWPLIPKPIFPSLIVRMAALSFDDPLVALVLLQKLSPSLRDLDLDR